MPCNVNLDFSNLQNEIVSKIGILLNVKEFVGTPPGLATLQGAIAGTLGTLKGTLTGLLPDLPFADEFLSLRGTLEKFAGQIDTDIGKLVGDLGVDFGAAGGLLDVNLDFNNLANSSIGLAFDPCALASGVPNLLIDKAGSAFLGPPSPPNKGLVSFGKQLSLAKQVFDDPLKAVQQAAGFTDINQLAASVLPNDLIKAGAALQSATIPSLSGLGGMLKINKSGQQSFESAESYLDEVKARVAGARLSENAEASDFVNKFYGKSFTELTGLPDLKEGDVVSVPIDAVTQRLREIRQANEV